VDFQKEALSCEEALGALQASGLDVGCPRPVWRFCGPHVLTMTFIEGWKITEVERLPPNTDRETMAERIVEAFAMLVFNKGLIHGDPHPGNIFVEQCHAQDGTERLRPCLLDWGMVRRVTLEEQRLIAKWVIASLSSDRFQYAETLSEMGVEFAEGISNEVLDDFMFGAMLGMRDTIPSSGMQQFLTQHRTQQKDKRNKEKKKREAEGKGKTMQKIIEKVPGWQYLFFRGLNLLQDVCGGLEVTVPVAKIMLKYALPVVASAASDPKAGLAAMEEPKSGRPDSASPVEQGVRHKLAELGDKSVLGVQVAVLCGDEGVQQDFAVTFATGKMGLVGAADLSEDSLMPLLDAGLGVLTYCLLATLSKPTVTGKDVGLETPVERLWPEFGRNGKAAITIRELLQHNAGLQKPFKSKATYKLFCNEQKMEECVSETHREQEGLSHACYVLGVAIAALLRRATGHKTAGEALQSVLKPLGLHEDICFFSSDTARMAHTGHQILEEVSMAALWEALEERQGRAKLSDSKPPPTMAWREFAMRQPWASDPLLVNSEELRSGKRCAVGRGLRATAQGLCRLFSSGAVPAELLRESCIPLATGRLKLESLEEWRQLACVGEVGVGWQLSRFRPTNGGAEVFGFGYADGATGSFALRIPGVASVSVLLSCVDRGAQHVGGELLAVIARELGLEFIPALPPPGVPDQPPALDNVGEGDDSGGDGGSNVREALLRLENRIERLAAAIETQGTTGRGIAIGSSSSLAGSWNSASVEGLDELLEGLNVPSFMRAMVKSMKRTLRFDVDGDHVSLTSLTYARGRKVEDMTLKFKVGDSFEGTVFNNSFTGSARWDDGCSTAHRVLIVEKNTKIRGHSVVLEERYEVMSNATQLRVCWTLRGQGQVEVSVDAASERQQLLRGIDRKHLRLTKAVEVGGRKLVRGGYLVNPTTLAELESAQVPGVVVFRYDDLSSTTTFDREGAAPSIGITSPDAAPDTQAARSLDGSHPSRAANRGCLLRALGSALQCLCCGGCSGNSRPSMATAPRGLD